MNSTSLFFQTQDHCAEHLVWFMVLLAVGLILLLINRCLPKKDTFQKDENNEDETSMNLPIFVLPPCALYPVDDVEGFDLEETDDSTLLLQ